MGGWWWWVGADADALTGQRSCMTWACGRSIALTKQETPRLATVETRAPTMGFPARKGPSGFCFIRLDWNWNTE